MNPYLMPALEKGPQAISRLVQAIDPKRLDERLDPERFTPREAICHLADWEPFWKERFEAGRDHPGSRIVSYDEGKMAIDGKYAERDALAEARRYVAGRKVVIALVSALKQDDWGKTIDHPERGILTLEDLANTILGHDMYHVEHLSAFLGEKTAGTW